MRGGVCMEKTISKYLHKHTFFISTVVVLSFLTLLGGEYYLFRHEMKLNKMISEGFMQLKESQRAQVISPIAVPTVAGASIKVVPVKK